MNFHRTRCLATATLLAAALLVPTLGLAQGMTVGVKGGINFGNLNDTYSGITNTASYRVGAIGGGFVAFDFNKSAGLMVEAFFSQKGSKASVTIPGYATFTDELLIDYIEVPVLGRVNLRGSDAVTVHLFAGPSFAFKAQDTQKANGQDVPSASRVDLKGSDVGFAFGLGVDIHRFLIDVRYTIGLINIAKDYTDQETLKNRAISVMAGVRFK